ncbi:hypothetical protein K491DRAFT_590251 [Lophiostoma macrostomum CBS 122681]|uniref:Uncharacterized protein n=1 Tax=Lophiostoma macrostomum CBS 122681 TaxID=1314788 RepID=A0A6A6TLT5_9PLEO|nr:hypothetical protein K491DRAFT_590251 [Lophiostoma macrostomum CBS 122681]
MPCSGRRSPLLGLLPLVLLPIVAFADVKPYITTSAEFNTECKTCPHSLCTNTAVYETNDSFNATCWARGTKIVDGNIWLKSVAGCYVTQYDVLEYSGDYTTDLEYCGKASEVENLTELDATLAYKTECNICPTIDCDNAAYLPEDTDLTLTCWTDQGSPILNNPYWYKTANNCYVAETGFHSSPERISLDNCGPIPYLELEKHFNENGTSDIDRRAPLPQPIEDGVKYLINVTVGEDHAYCRKCAEESCRIQEAYPFNSWVVLQCLVETNGTWWSESTDFCYVKNSDFWESPEGDNYKMPLCDDFPDPDGNKARR